MHISNSFLWLVVTLLVVVCTAAGTPALSGEFSTHRSAGQVVPGDKIVKYAEAGISLMIPQDWEEAVAFIGGKPDVPTITAGKQERISPTIDTIYISNDWSKTKAEIRLLVYQVRVDEIAPSPTEGRQLSFATKDACEVLVAPVTSKNARGRMVRSELTLTEALSGKEVKLIEECVYFHNKSAVFLLRFRAEASAFEKMERTVFRRCAPSVSIVNGGYTQLVLGRASAIDEEHSRLQTYLAGDDILALWSRSGWKNKHVYFDHDNQSIRHKGDYPWIDEEGEVSWLGADPVDPCGKKRFLMWRIKGLEAYDHHDAPVELNEPGKAFLQKLFEMNYVMITGRIPGEHRVFLMSKSVVRNQRTPPKDWSAAIEVGDGGQVMNVLEYNKSGLKKWLMGSRISVSEPPWYPKIAP